MMLLLLRSVKRIRGLPEDLKTMRFSSTAAVVMVAVVAGSLSAVAVEHKPGDLTRETMRLTTREGAALDVETGTLYVPENRGDSQSRVIGIGWARIRGNGRPVPTFHLP